MLSHRHQLMCLDFNIWFDNFNDWRDGACWNRSINRPVFLGPPFTTKKTSAGCFHQTLFSETCVMICCFLRPTRLHGFLAKVKCSALCCDFRCRHYEISPNKRNLKRWKTLIPVFVIMRSKSCFCWSFRNQKMLLIKILEQRHHESNQHCRGGVVQ